MSFAHWRSAKWIFDPTTSTDCQRCRLLNQFRTYNETGLVDHVAGKEAVAGWAADGKLVVQTFVASPAFRRTKICTCHHGRHRWGTIPILFKRSRSKRQVAPLRLRRQ